MDRHERSALGNLAPALDVASHRRKRQLVAEILQIISRQASGQCFAVGAIEIMQGDVVRRVVDLEVERRRRREPDEMRRDPRPGSALEIFDVDSAAVWAFGQLKIATWHCISEPTRPPGSSNNRHLSN